MSLVSTLLVEVLPLASVHIVYISVFTAYGGGPMCSGLPTPPAGRQESGEGVREVTKE